MTINGGYRALACGVLLGVLTRALPAMAVDNAPKPLQPTGQWMGKSFGDAPLPPMGWNSWNAFHQPDRRMVVRTRIFPSAQGPTPDETSFRPLVDWLHSLGLKAGIYSDIERNACSQGYAQPDSLLPTGSTLEREVGLYDHVSQDLSLYFKDFDYIKLDGCGINAFSADHEGGYPPWWNHISLTFYGMASAPHGVRLDNVPVPSHYDAGGHALHVDIPDRSRAATLAIDTSP